MKATKIMLISALTIIPTIALAQDNSEDEAPSNYFADCGIGGALFKNDTGATISNIIWDLGTTAVTSGISSPETCEGDNVAVAEFINNTYVSISEDTVRGEGVHLSAMLDLAGCSSDVRPTVVSSLRDALSQDLTKTGYSEKSNTAKAEAYFDNVRASTAGQCNLS